MDSQLNMSAHLTAVCRSCLFQLRQLGAVRHSPWTRVGSFISSRLDDCNSLLAGVKSGLLTKFQSVPNAAARFIMMSWKFDHIAPILHDLSWQHVRQRIDFEVPTLVFKCLQCYAPPYLAEDACSYHRCLVGSSCGLQTHAGCSFLRSRRTTHHGLLSL
jgi:hypothetical protein